MFLSFPYSHGGWTKLTTSQFVRSQNIFTDRRCLRIKFANRVPTIRIPDKSWKRLSSLSHMVWCSSGIFQVLERTKQTKSPWFKSRKDSVGGGAGFPCQKFRTNSSSLDLFTEKLLYRCHEPVECMNVEFARHVVKFSHTFSDFVDVRCRERSGILAERSGILLRGPDRKEPDRLAANQSARFAGIPDRKKIKLNNLIKYWKFRHKTEIISNYCTDPYKFDSQDAFVTKTPS